jgi:hypothetical protein
MPNWVITRIYITGPEDKIKEFEDKAIRLEEEKVFSFNRINKRPEELDNTQCPPLLLRARCNAMGLSRCITAYAV